MGKFAFKPVNAPASAPAVAAPAIDVQSTVVADAPAPAAAPVAAPVVSGVSREVSGGSAPAIRPAAGAVVEYRPAATYGDDSERVGVKDITLPRLNFVQKVGDLSNIFTPGDIVLNKESVVYKAPTTNPVTKAITQNSPPLRLVVVGFRPDRYVEKTQGGVQGAIVDSPEQVVAGGGTISYDEANATGKPLFQQLAEALVLIEQPEGITDPAFSYVADGKRWAAALWAQKGSAFTNGAKVFRTARKAGWLKDDVDASGQVVKRGYFHGVWEITSLLKPYGTGNFAWIPVPKRGTETGPELRALATKLLG